MKKIIFVLLTALTALFVIFSVDKYNTAKEKDRLIAESIKASEKSSSEAADTTTTTTALETTTEVTTTEPPSENWDELNTVEYKEASIVPEKQFKKNLVSQSAILVNMNDKSILYDKNAEEKMSPASTTKLMTAITVLQILKKGEEVTVGNEIYMIGEGSSTAFLEVGDTLTVEQLLQGLLVASGNDAAYVLAVRAGKKIAGEGVGAEIAVKKFVEVMNQNVNLLGLKHTRFASPDGYDADNQYTTAKDLAAIAYAAYQDDLIKNICALPSVYVPAKGITWMSTNRLIDPDSEYYYDKVKGMKTGSTGDAGKCLVSVAADGESEYISVVMNSSEEGRWTDSLKLLKYGVKLKK